MLVTWTEHRLPRTTSVRGSSSFTAGLLPDHALLQMEQRNADLQKHNEDLRNMVFGLRNRLEAKQNPLAGVHWQVVSAVCMYHARCLHMEPQKRGLPLAHTCAASQAKVHHTHGNDQRQAAQVLSVQLCMHSRIKGD